MRTTIIICLTLLGFLLMGFGFYHYKYNKIAGVMLMTIGFTFSVCYDILYE